MNMVKRAGSLSQAALPVLFNARALRHALQQHLLSWEFLAGFTCWALSAGVIFFQWWEKWSFPGWVMIVLVLFSLFSGCCWVLAPVSVSLESVINHWLGRKMPSRTWLQVFTGSRLWHQAAHGKLSWQLLATFLVGILLWFMAFQWGLNQPWRAWIVVAFFANALLFVICPLFIFLEARIHRGPTENMPL